ncbi:mechanosensitive ion channel family protein [Confluentibacter sediminis]|uniref:mechanosensitive ion channel family protein n=1 Tax=Confluentibacter sediminis TaxID=2219045 RepID=UPI000DAE2B9C|nr:mechanosensitive ion channel domain-containing protein [Confluentibacter sediminis]
MNLENIDAEKWIELATTYGLRILGAIAIWIIGSWLIKKVLNTARKIMTKSDYDISLQKFLINLFNWALKILLIITLLGTLGVPTTSFAAVIAAAGLAIGLALQGSLGNFAGGVLIMIFKPFKIGDVIEAQGEIGSVKQIEIFTTKLIGLSNKEIIIPNGALSNGNIVNYTTEGTRRVDLVFGVGYDSDIKKTKEVLMDVLKNNPKILDTPEPTVNVLELANSSVNFAVRPWCNAADYWSVYFEVTESTKEALDAAGIEIPYPHQVEIHKNA